ncbi:MAG: alkaline phosphatase family protein [Anaerolineales bacterium]|nr:alkaline phosphatase family protein [Anaerolineales bacterium]
MILKKFFVFLFVFVLVGCGSNPDLWGYSLPPEPAVTSIYFQADTPIPTIAASSTATPLPTSTPVPTATLTPTPSFASIKRVLIISYDGMRPDAIPLAPMPILMDLVSKGAYSFTSAETIDYPATSPSHASMLSGLCMDKHGMIYDRYFKYMGYSKGVDVFDLAHAAGMRTVMIVGKDKLRQLAEPETTDVFEVRYGEPAISKEAVVQINEGFGLMFVHFAGPDLRGHKYSWMSGEYMKVLRQGDEALGLILDALKANNLLDSTLIIVTADHGGHDKNHIGLVIEDFRIPWIASGPGVVPGELTFMISTTDTAVTAAYALGLPLQPDWDGIPVYAAFGQPMLTMHEKNPCR